MNPTSRRAAAPAKRLFPAALPCLALAGLALAGLLLAPQAARADQPEGISQAVPQTLAEDGGASRAASVQPARTVIVKAMGQGTTPQEAEAAALKHARTVAAKHLARLGGALALLPGAEGQRIINVHHFPVMGMAQPRTSVLVELRLRGQAEPLPANAGLPVVSASVADGVLKLSSTKACEAVAALDRGKGEELVLLPGAVHPFRLVPGKTTEQVLPAAGPDQTLRVLACTGGLIIPANPGGVDEAFTRARVTRPHPSLMEGVVSDCVELRLGRAPDRADAPKP